MTKMKTITKPQLRSARRLSASEMNNIHFSSQRTLLTPEMLSASAVDTAAPLPSSSGSKAADTDIDFG